MTIAPLSELSIREKLETLKKPKRPAIGHPQTRHCLGDCKVKIRNEINDTLLAPYHY
jgi:hypothetical protein